MKYWIFAFFALTTVFVSGCKKNTIPSDQPKPSGVFSGQFLFVHRPNTTAKYDTIKANIILAMQSPANSYAVTGDTSKHAGSHGSYAIVNDLINFNDATYPLNGSTPPKKHLSGVYTYFYDGTNLQLLGFNSDTSAFEYVLKKN